MRERSARVGALVALLIFLCQLASGSCKAEPVHGLAMHGELKYPAGFRQFDYVDTIAPQGGELVYADVGGFDSLNPFLVRGRPAPSLRDYVFESLLARSYDEPFSLYGLLAESVETPQDRGWVEFTLNGKARFSDGQPVTVDDVIHTHSLLRDFGRPNHRFYYSKANRVEQTGPRRVRFTFRAGETDREMPLIIGLMPVLPKHVYSRERFERVGLDRPVGSGPYLVEAINAGESITYRRDPAYWGNDLAIRRGHHHLERVKFLFYRDNNVLFEDFKKGVHHLRIEESPDRWAKSYDFPATRDGRIIKEERPLGAPAPMIALAFNTRRAPFHDRRVREALNLLFDFERINRDLFHGLYKRTRSFFDRSELSSAGRPADEREQTLLSRFKEAVKPEIMASGYTPPISDGTGRNRRDRGKALHLLAEAGYELRAGVMTDKASGKPFSFEILSAQRDQQRLLLSYADMLRRVGIEASVRFVDSAQYEQRKTTYDFDMTPCEWASSLSPGNEQSFRWGSRAAAENGSFNFAGVANPAVDALIAATLEARSRRDFVSAVRALDRVLLSGDYVIPLYHLPGEWIALWKPFQYPDTNTLYGLRLDSLVRSKASYDR